LGFDGVKKAQGIDWTSSSSLPKEPARAGGVVRDGSQCVHFQPRSLMIVRGYIAGTYDRKKVTVAVDYLNTWIAPIEALARIDEKSVRKTSTRCLRV